MPEMAEMERDDEPLEVQTQEAPPDFQEVANDPSAAENIGRIISEAMINGPWTGC